MTQTIGLFGGSFNPPHVAHEMVCLYVLETAAVDQVWMVPTWNHPFQKDLAPFEDRFAMCERAAEIFAGRVVVSRIEEELGREQSRTLDTIEALYARSGDVALRLVVGADILGETDKWHRWDEITRLAPPIVVGRPGYADPEPEDDIAFEMPAISSTEVRKRLRAGKSAVPLVSRAVMEYIAGRGLYR